MSSNIFEYVNYRAFLADFLSNKREENPAFSHRAILQRIGVSSSGFLSNVLAGKKNLSSAQRTRLSKVLKLPKKESLYFENLVQFNQAKTLDEKNEFFDRMVSLRTATAKKLSQAQQSIFAKWYFVFVHEMLSFSRIQGMGNEECYAEIARKLDPPIKPSEAASAIQELETMGLVKKNEEGFYKPCDAYLSTGNEVKSLELANFQLRTMDLAKRALEKISVEERDISVLTMSLSQDGFRRIKSEIQNFRKNLAKIALEDRDANRVYQCNFQFFPVTKKES